MVVQLVEQGTLRHRNEGVLVHITMAVVVTVLVMMCGFRRGGCMEGFGHCIGWGWRC